MRAIRIHRYGTNDELRLEEVPAPKPGPRDLLVRVHAAGVNPVDYKIRKGQIRVLVHYDFPLTLGNDLSGEVVEIGAEVRRFKVGDMVFGRLSVQNIGSFADYVRVDENVAALKPENLTHIEAASLPLVGLTSWQAMRDIGKLAPGQKVLIHAGSGGVGTFAIQLAKHWGAVVATTAGARNFALLKRLGADQVLDYKQDKFEDLLHDFDLVFDTQGGGTLERSFQVVRRGGTIVTINGIPDGKFAKQWGLNPLLVLAFKFLTRKITRLAQQRGVHFEFFLMHADGQQLAQIAELLSSGVIKPVVDRSFPLAEAKQALAYVEAGRAVGKAVISMLETVLGDGENASFGRPTMPELNV